MATKTLFLDFDGVLHPTLAEPEEHLGRARLLAAVLEQHKPDVVISSSWRFHFPMSEILDRLPVHIRSRVVGITGDAFIGKHARWHEIRSYCAQHRISDWRALDDSAFEFPPDCPQLIRCDGGVGIGEREILALREWLVRRKPCKPRFAP